MEFDTKTYILLGGSLLIGLVLLHGFYLAWRNRRQTPALSVAGGADQAAEQMPLDMDAALLPEDAAAQAAPMQRTEPTVGADAPVHVDVPEDPTLPARAALARRLQQTNGGLETKRRKGRRIEIAGKRTEPSVPRSSRRRGDVDASAEDTEPANAEANGEFEDAELAPAANGAEPEDAAESPEDNAADELLLLWVVAKPNAALTAPGLLETFTEADLQYDGQVFRRADDEGVYFTVANGVEPGTFDLSDVDAFATPGVAFLLRLSTAPDPAAAFDAMLQTAQALAANLDAELKDEERSDVSGQTIVYYRQRIHDFTHRAMRG